MNSLTMPNSTFQIKKKVNVYFDKIVVPAPFAFRPFFQCRNPYTGACSVLCNHPTDIQTKRIISKAKNIFSRKCGITLESDERTCFCECEQQRTVIPEILFRHYTESNSRSASPTTIQPIVSADGDDHNVTDSCECVKRKKTTGLLVVSLDKRLSRNPVKSNHENCTHLLPAVRKIHNNLILNSSTGGFKGKDPLGLTLKSAMNNVKIIRSNKKICSKGGKWHRRPSIKKVSPDGIETKETRNIPTLKIKTRSKMKKIKIKSKKLKNVKRKCTNTRQDSSLECTNLAEPDETQISTVHDVNIFCNDEKITEKNIDSITNEDPSRIITDYHINLKLMNALRKEFNVEMSVYEFDSKKRMVFEELFSSFTVLDNKFSVDSCAQQTLIKIHSNSKKTVDELLLFPRTFAKKNSRFEIPVNNANLEKMKPLEYLKSHVFISAVNCSVYSHVFRIYANGNFINYEKLFAALTQIIGRKFTCDERTFFSNTIILTRHSQIDFRTWCGICVLCERFFLQGEDMLESTNSFYDLEYADFEFLNKKIYKLNLNEQLRKILYYVRDSYSVRKDKSDTNLSQE